jgi:hypothetical protein
VNLEATAAFGKHKGRTARWVMANDPGYWNWAAKAVPDLFKAKPEPVAKPEVAEGDGEEDTGKTWISAHDFYAMAMAYHREKGEDI